MISVTLDNRDGTVWDLQQVAYDVSLRTSRTGKPASVESKLLGASMFSEPTFKVNCGDVVRIRSGEEQLFKGYVFAIEESQERTVSITAYDQLRYLLEADTYVRANVTATQVIRDNALAVGLNLGGDLADTKFAIPTFSQDGQKRLDMIFAALDQTLMATGRTYVFFDDAGNLRLRDVEDMAIDLIIGDGSLVYGYSLTREIDSDTYNRVKLVKDNKETGRREAYVLQDSDTIAKWGRLQYYQKVDEGFNEAQINAMLDRFMELKNREQRKFSLEALGYIGMRAGVKLQVNISELGINQYFLVEECTHRFSGQNHTMNLELKVYG